MKIEGPTFDLDPEFDEVHTVTSVFKSYLRELPEDLVTISSHYYLAYDPQQMMSNEDLPFSSVPTQVLQEELVKLPFCNFTMLHVLIRHFANVVQHQDENKMTLSNLAVVFGPTLRMNKLLFMALVSRGDLLWRDLHPNTPKPASDPTFNSVEPYSNEFTKSTDMNMTNNSEEFDFDQPENHKPQFSMSSSNSYNSYNSYNSAPLPMGKAIGIGISNLQPLEGSNNGNHNTNTNTSTKISGSMSSSISTRSLRSLESSPETIMTEPEFDIYDHYSRNTPKTSTAIAYSSNHNLSSHSTSTISSSSTTPTLSSQRKFRKAPRALFLKPSGPSYAQSSFSAPATPATPTYNTNLHSQFS